MDGKLVFLGLVALGVAIVLAILRLTPRRHRPLGRLAAPHPPKPELGMEATDMDAARQILDRNAALARKTGASGHRASWTEVGAASGKTGHDKRP